MQALAYDACLPHLPVMLHTRRHVDSFCMLLESNPDTVGPRIRTLWVVASIRANLEYELGQTILRRCTRITHMACNINLLKALVFSESSTAFAHHDLKDLTLIEPVIPWVLLLSYPAGHQLFGQLTHLRTNGSTKFDFPNFIFSALTHLSFSCHQLPSDTMFDATRFPVLQQIVPSLPYMFCRTSNAAVLGVTGRAIDSRIDVIACPKKWKEADVWEKARREGKGLWTSARSGEYLQESRAFTQEPPRWDYDDFDDIGGESGL